MISSQVELFAEKSLVIHLKLTKNAPFWICGLHFRVKRYYFDDSNTITNSCIAI